jgi:NTE family protein
MVAVTNLDLKPTSAKNYLPHERKPGLALSLSGGGARGLAHIGILEGLEHNHIEIAALSGASMGGVIGALYASGLTGAELHQLSSRLARPRELIKLVELRPGRRGLVSQEKLSRLLAEYIDPSLSFADLRIPLLLTATDLDSGELIQLQQGPLLPAVMATCAFPGVFPPVEFDGRLLVDGGVLNNLPVDLLAKRFHNPLVAIDVSPQAASSQNHHPVAGISRMPAVAEVLYRATILMNHAVTESILEQQPPDLLITPAIPEGIGVFDGFSRCEDIIRSGRKALDEQLRPLQQLSGKVALDGSTPS